MVIGATMAVASFAFAGYTKVQMPLTEERIWNDKTEEKLCIYSVEINLGDSKTAKPFQILKMMEEDRYYEVKYSHFITINSQGHMILNVKNTGTAAKEVGCEPHKEFVLLN